MKKTKKIITVLTLLGVLLIPTNAHAQTWKVHNEGRGFTSSWEASQGDSSFGFKYGFETDWLDEDYCYSIYKGSHQSAISNGNGGHETRSVKGGIWAQLKVRHSGSAVWYGMIY
ncbi:hypothetical protein [Clostridium sp. UBA1056]|uniref:mediterrocin family bacteriocin n=1 Tax=unclassified Clostridium TaxID=2614128 RepID=UPI003216E5E2